MNKNNYMIYCSNLQLCLELGMKLKKVHRILKFKQKVWMKPYIDFNTQKRKEATNDADKNHFKLLKNAVYSKTMENLRTRIKIRIVENEKHIVKHISKPSYVSHKIFDKNLVAIHEKKISLTLNKPIYVGFTVLEINTLPIYAFHYEFMRKIFDDFKLFFTDTDSLCYEICNENPYEKFYEHREYFDLSNFPKNSKYFCNDNKKVLGKMKDEYGGKVIKEFIGLRSKMYSTLDTKINEKSTHKRHNSYIKYEEFGDTLFNKKVHRHKMRGIKSKIHNLIYYESNKTTTSCFDDERYIQENGIDTLRYGHT